MKATVLVRLKTEVLDVQGDAVRRALGKLGFEGVKDVRVGKIIEIEIDAAHAKAPDLKERLQKMADEMLANPRLCARAIQHGHLERAPHGGGDLRRASGPREVQPGGSRGGRHRPVTEESQGACPGTALA